MPPHAPNVDQQQPNVDQRKGFRHLSHDEKVQIWTFLGQGFSCRKIAAIIGHDATTVCRLAKKWKISKSLDRTIGSGRPRITSAVDDRALIRHVRNDRFASATDLQKLSPFENCRLEPYAGGSLSLVYLTPIGQPTNDSSRNLTEWRG